MTGDPQYEESYRFRFTQGDLRELHQMRERTAYLKTVLLGLAAVYFALYAIFEKSVLMAILAIVMVVLVADELSAVISGLKALKKQLEQVDEMGYEYYFGMYSFLIRNAYQDERAREIRASYHEITKVFRYGDWLILSVGNWSVPIRQSQLAPNAALLSHLYRNPHKIKEIKKIDRWWVTSAVLFVAALASLWIAMALTSVVSDSNGDVVHNMWVFYLMTPIPLASVVFSFVLKRKGRKYKKNLIAGIIVAALLCVYGSFPFIFKDAPDLPPEPGVYQQSNQ